MKRFQWLVVVIQLLSLVGGCTIAQHESTYRLSSEHLNQDIDPGMPLAIVIDYVTVPDVVDRPEFVLRVNQRQVRIDKGARWGEPLKKQIANVIAADLRQLFRDAVVSTSEQTNARPTVRLAIDVHTFDSIPGRGAVLGVSWSMLTPDSQRALNGNSIVIQQVDGEGYDALIDAHSRALAAVSVDIATTIMSGIRKNPAASGRIWNVMDDKDQASRSIDVLAQARAMLDCDREKVEPRFACE